MAGQKRLVVRLSGAVRRVLPGVVWTFAGTSQKERQAQVRCKADKDDPARTDARTDARIVAAIGCRRRRVETMRQRLVERGLRETVERAQREEPPGVYANGTPRWLAREVAALERSDSVHRETVRQKLKRAA